MDAEVWSHADIRNGQRLFPLLVLIVLCKEGAVIAGLALNLPWAAWLDPVGQVPGSLTPAAQSLLAFGLTILLLAIAYFGRAWALTGFGLSGLLSSGAALWSLVPTVSVPGTRIDMPLAVALANAVLGVAVGAAALWLPQLRAFIWSRASARLVIPLPDDEAPPRRSWRKQRTLGESLIALGQVFVNLLLVLLVLLIAAYVYGFGDELRGLLMAF